MDNIKDITKFGELSTDSRFVVVRRHFLADEVDPRNDKNIHGYQNCDLYWLYSSKRYFVSVNCDSESSIVYHTEHDKEVWRDFYVRTKSPF